MCTHRHTLQLVSFGILLIKIGYAIIRNVPLNCTEISFIFNIQLFFTFINP